MKSHTNISGNNIIDIKVRKLTKQITYNKNHFIDIPCSVTLTQIHQFITKKWKSLWILKSNPNKWITKCHSKFNRNIHILINKSKFNSHQCGVIIRMITEHIELNQYLYKLQLKCPVSNEIPSSPDCLTCRRPESTKHFLLHCKKFAQQRYKLFSNLSRINHKYNYSKFRIMKYLLFPICFGEQHSPTDVVWKEVLSYKSHKQVQQPISYRLNPDLTNK